MAGMGEMNFLSPVHELFEGNAVREKTRNTRRKNLIEHVVAEEFGAGPVLLEELRWRVLMREFQEKEQTLSAMTTSLMKSFALRTDDPGTYRRSCDEAL